MSEKSPPSNRMAWLEGIRIFAAVMILLYHAQLLVTKYAYTPQPTGFLANLSLLASVGDRDPFSSSSLFSHTLLDVLNLPFWFGFQFVDVFVLISGFSLVLSLKQHPLVVGKFLSSRFLRILYPLWIITWLSYPLLWLIGTLTHSYIPDTWHFFAAATFPLLYDYAGEPLLALSGPWWFVSLILSFTLIFPLLWQLLQRWGTRNLLLVSLLLTLGYRTLAAYLFGGHPTYVILDTPASWLPFVPFIAKLSTFVVGMVAAIAFLQGKGPLFWQSRKALLVGMPLYAIGSLCQFYRVGWIFADLLVPLGLSLCCMVVFRSLAHQPQMAAVMTQLGARSYSFFLIHNFIVDRTINLVVKNKLAMYYLLLPGMVVMTLLLAYGVDWLTPKVQKGVLAFLKIMDARLSRRTKSRSLRRSRPNQRQSAHMFLTSLLHSDD